MSRQINFIAKVAPLAQKDMTKSGVLASLTIAQAILESGWGGSGLTKNGNALFGIKATKSWTGKRMNCKTFEYYGGERVDIVDCFRAYDSWEHSINDHSAFLQGVRLGNGVQRYKAVLGEKDYKKACHSIHKAGYATAPNYATSLIKIIDDYKLYQYDKVVKEYQVRVFTFSTKLKADNARSQILNLGYHCTVEPLDNSIVTDGKHQVRVWSFSTKDKANAAKVRIANLGYYCEVEEMK